MSLASPLDMLDMSVVNRRNSTQTWREHANCKTEILRSGKQTDGKEREEQKQRNRGDWVGFLPQKQISHCSHHLVIQTPLFPSFSDSPYGWQLGVSIWCQLQIVRHWRGTETQGCGASDPHSSQFTHQTLPSTIRPLRKVTLLLNNSLSDWYCWKGRSAIATICLVRKAQMNNGTIETQSHIIWR